MLNTENGIVRRSRKITTIVVLCALAPLYVFLGVLGYWWLLDDATVMEVTGVSRIFNGHTRKETNTFAPGDTMIVVWESERFRDCATHYDRTLHDTAIRLLRPQFIQSAPLGKTIAPVSVRIPLGLPPGDYTYEVDVSFACNPLQRFWPLKFKFPEVAIKIAMDADYIMKQKEMFLRREGVR